MKRLPMSVQIVAGLLVLEGLWAIVRSVIQWNHRQPGMLDVPVDAMNLFIGVGLFRRSARWRSFAVGWLWLGIVFAAGCLALVVFSGRSSSDIVLAGYFAGFCVFSLYALFVLTRPHVMECFGNGMGGQLSASVSGQSSRVKQR